MHRYRALTLVAVAELLAMGLWFGVSAVALTLQTCIGFLITTVSIRMMPLLVERVGWEWAFAFLAPGPLLGIIAMMRLRGATTNSCLSQPRAS